jgi:hypothetical protein
MNDKNTNTRNKKTKITTILILVYLILILKMLIAAINNANKRGSDIISEGANKFVNGTIIKYRYNIFFN